MTQQVFEGTLEELSKQFGGLRGKRLRLIVLDNEVQRATSSEPFYKTATPEEWTAAFSEWAASHPRNAPLLSDEAVSRESMYADRLDKQL